MVSWMYVRIYLDYNATAPVPPAVVDAVTAALRECYGNASSVHVFGQQAKTVLDESRSAIARLIGAEPSEIVFTAGGTESDNLAVRGVAEILAPAGRRGGHTRGAGRDPGDVRSRQVKRRGPTHPDRADPGTI